MDVRRLKQNKEALSTKYDLIDDEISLCPRCNNMGRSAIKSITAIGYSFFVSLAARYSAN